MRYVIPFLEKSGTPPVRILCLHDYICTVQFSLEARGCTNRKFTGSIPDGVIGIFHWHISSGRTMTLVDSASNRNEYQEYFLRVKAAGT
jgi:hypothetical protein